MAVTSVAPKRSVTRPIDKQMQTATFVRGVAVRQGSIANAFLPHVNDPSRRAHRRSKKCKSTLKGVDTDYVSVGNPLHLSSSFSLVKES